jgi:hypothetical protein
MLYEFIHYLYIIRKETVLREIKSALPFFAVLPTGTLYKNIFAVWLEEVC